MSCRRDSFDMGAERNGSTVAFQDTRNGFTEAISSLDAVLGGLAVQLPVCWTWWWTIGTLCWASCGVCGVYNAAVKSVRDGAWKLFGVRWHADVMSEFIITLYNAIQFIPINLLHTMYNIRVNVYVCMYICIYIYIHIINYCTCICIGIYIYIHIHMCKHIYICLSVIPWNSHIPPLPGVGPPLRCAKHLWIAEFRPKSWR